MIAQGDCLEVLKALADESVDMVLTDPPYSKTECDWDKPIDLEALFHELDRVISPTGSIAIFSVQPFTTDLINAYRTKYKYSWYWLKPNSYGFVHAKNKPMTRVEEVLIFSKGAIAHAGKSSRRQSYYPQGVVKGKLRTIKPSISKDMQRRPNQWGREYQSYKNFPSNVLCYGKPMGTKSLHPSEKPVALCKYLIETYTVSGQTVLDCFAGSGTTGVAARQAGREYILIEKEEKYIEIIKERVGQWKQH